MRAPARGSRFGSIVAATCYLAFGLAVLVSSQLRPYHNWDLLPYLAAARSLETSDPAELHRFAYEEVRKSVSPAIFANLRSGNDYRSAVCGDPELFAEQLPFYRIRPLYTASVYLLYRSGVGPVFATHLISGVCVFLGIILLYYLGRRRLAGPLLFTLPILALALGVLDIARLSTPDGMAFLGVLLAAWLLLEGRPGLVVVAPLLVVVRTDLILSLCRCCSTCSCGRPEVARPPRRSPSPCRCFSSGISRRATPTPAG